MVISDITHMIRGPLTTIKLQLALARAKDTQSEMTQVIKEQTQMIQAILEDMQIIEAVHDGKMKPKIQKVDLRQLADKFAQDNPRIELAVDSDNVVQINADRVQAAILIDRLVRVASYNNDDCVELALSEQQIAVTYNGKPELNRAHRSSMHLATIHALAELNNYDLDFAYKNGKTTILIKRLAEL